MTASHTLTDTVGAVLRRLPRFRRSTRPGNLPAFADGKPALCPDATPAGAEVERLRESARRLGVLPPEALGWFGTLLRERLRRSLADRTTLDWERLYPGLTVDERADRHVARAARRSALAGGLSAAGAHVGEAVTLLTDGLAAPLCVPAILASLASEVVASAKVQIDLVFDLASIHGAAFDVSDTAELAAIFELALHAGGATGAGRAGHEACRSTEDEILARLGRALLEDALLGLVPFVGIPFSAATSYRATLRVGAVARRSLRRRVALREALRGLASRASPALLLEGVWLLATADGRATHEELLVLASVARALACDERAALDRLDRLDATDERRWLAAAVSLEAKERAVLFDALLVIAGLRGPTRHPERRFLARVGDALGLGVDFSRIDAIHQLLEEGSGGASN